MIPIVLGAAAATPGGSSLLINGLVAIGSALLAYFYKENSNSQESEDDSELKELQCQQEKMESQLKQAVEDLTQRAHAHMQEVKREAYSQEETSKVNSYRLADTVTLLNALGQEIKEELHPAFREILSRIEQNPSLQAELNHKIRPRPMPGRYTNKS